MTALATITMRLREPLRDQIEKAATARGVSMNAEMVDRLSGTFSDQNHAHAQFGGREFFNLMLGFALAMQNAGRQAHFLRHHDAEAAERWWSDPYAFDQAAHAAQRLLEAFRPPGDPTPPASVLATAASDTGPIDIAALAPLLGQAFANSAINELLGPGAAGEAARKALGEIAHQAHWPELKKDGAE